MHVEGAMNKRLTETFQDILQRSLNSKSDSRNPKIELTGLLIPCHQEVQGHLEICSNIFEVERITLREIDDPVQVPASFREMPYDLEAYERIIFKKGKIEPAIEYLAS